MDGIYLALFEGALLFQAGIPVRDMYDHVHKAYGDDREVSHLFSDLKTDWDSTDTLHPLKMVGPFISREDKNPEFTFGRWFTELAAATSMVDMFWKSCGHAYVLKKRITANAPQSSDMNLAREIFVDFEPSHPLMAYLFSLSKDATWTIENFQAGHETATFADWAEAHSLKGPTAEFRCIKAVEEAAARAAYPELTEDTKRQWEIYSGALAAIK